MGPTASVWKLRKKRRAQLHHVRIDKKSFGVLQPDTLRRSPQPGGKQNPLHGPLSTAHHRGPHIYILDIAGNPNAHHLLGVQSATTHVHESWNTPFWYVSELCLTGVCGSRKSSSPPQPSPLHPRDHLLPSEGLPPWQHHPPRLWRPLPSPHSNMDQMRKSG